MQAEGVARRRFDPPDLSGTLVSSLLLNFMVTVRILTGKILLQCAA